MAKSFIHYERKKGIEYASVYTPRRINGKKDNAPLYLGRVIDKEKGVYKSRKRGVFSYHLDTGFAECAVPPDAESDRITTCSEEKLILDFGDAFLLDSVIKSSKYLNALSSCVSSQADKDTLLALISYRILSHEAHCYAQDWYDGSYARILYPNAQLHSQRISEFLDRLGEERVHRSFFAEYLSSLTQGVCKEGILIDSTGMPNQIHFPLTAVNTHGGKTNKEARLIMVVDRASGLPLFFRYNAGNIVDVTTLSTTIRELLLMGVHASFTILDSGYFSEANIRALYNENIAFLTRLGENRTLYKRLVREHAQELQKSKYIVIQRDRIVHIKRVKIDLYGQKGYAYVAIDETRRKEEGERYIRSAIEDGIPAEQMDNALLTKGMFVLVSSEKIDTDKILPLYYTRQQVEQIFDVNKTSVDLLPLRTHNEARFRGHLLIVFMATVLRTLLAERLASGKINVNGALITMRNLKCKVYDDKVLVKEPTRKMKEVALQADIVLPQLV